MVEYRQSLEKQLETLRQTVLEDRAAISKMLVRLDKLEKANQEMEYKIQYAGRTITKVPKEDWPSEGQVKVCQSHGITIKVDDEGNPMEDKWTVGNKISESIKKNVRLPPMGGNF